MSIPVPTPDQLATLPHWAQHYILAHQQVVLRQVATNPMHPTFHNRRLRVFALFDGAAEDVPQFIQDVQDSINSTPDAFDSDLEKCIHMAQFFGPQAQEWYTALRVVHPDCRNDFDAFVKSFEDFFDPRGAALAKLASLRQTGSVVAYSAAFDKIADLLHLPEPSAMDHYRAGLKTNVKRALDDLASVELRAHDLTSLQLLARLAYHDLVICAFANGGPHPDDDNDDALHLHLPPNVPKRPDPLVNHRSDFDRVVPTSTNASVNASRSTSQSTSSSSSGSRSSSVSTPDPDDMDIVVVSVKIGDRPCHA